MIFFNIMLCFYIPIFIFDILCIVSLFLNSNISNYFLRNYITSYLLFPYMFFEKNKIINLIIDSIIGENESIIDLNRNKNKNFFKLSEFLEWTFYLVLFVCGLFYDVTKNYQSDMLYWLGIIVLLMSGIYCVAKFILMCCGMTISIIREPIYDNEITVSLMKNHEV